MHCNISELFELYPQLTPYYSNGKVNIKALPLNLREGALKWIDEKNKVSRELGFTETLYPTEYKKDSNGIDTIILNINTDKIDRYLSHIENVVKPDLMIERQATQEFTNIFIDDTELSDESLEAQEIDYTYDSNNDNYFEPVSLGQNTFNTLDIFDEPANFSEWLDQRKAILKKLHAQRDRMYRLKEDRKDVNKFIEMIEKEIDKFDPTDITILHTNISNEIAHLRAILQEATSNTTDSVKASRLIENNYVKDRLDNLTLLLSDSKRGGDFYINFRAGLNPETVNPIIAQLSDLRDKYDSSLENLIYNVLMDNELISQNREMYIREGREDLVKEFEEKVKALLDPDNNLPENRLDGGNFLGKNFLGASSYDNLLSELLVITRDISKNKEAGVTSQWKNNLKIAYDKIKRVKIDGEYLVDLLIEQDEFGLKSNKLIHYVNKSYRQNFSLFDSLRKDYLFSKGPAKIEAYKDWMQTLSETSDYIELYKIKSFVNEYSENPEFSDYFTYSETEMDEYERDMREKMGNIAFEIELQNQVEKTVSFLTDSFSSTKEKMQQHPLAFVNHFYSEEFTTYDSHGLFPVPFYNSSIPSVNFGDYYSQNFKDLELRQIDGFKDYYINAKNLIDYTRETALNEGLDMGHNDIMNLEDNLGREAMKNLTWYQKVPKIIGEAIREYFSEFRNVNLENPDLRKDYVRKFRSHFTNHGKKEAGEMRRLYMQKTHAELVDKANQLGLNIPAKYLNDRPNSISKLADAIVRDTILKTSSMDMHKRITNGASIAESVNTRRSVSSILSLMKDYTKLNNFDVTKNFLDNWEVNNILQVGYVESSKNEGLSKVERLKVWKKTYTQLEAELKKLYEEEKNNNNTHLDFKHTDSEGKETHYFTKKGQFYKKDSEGKTHKIKTSEIQSKYDAYLDSKLEDLGKNMRVGNVLNGLVWNMFKSYLWLSPASGVKNRLAGYNQNNQGAASNLNGYSMADLINARKLLVGHNTRKYISMSGLTEKLGLDKTRRKQQVGIVNYLAENLKLLDNVAQDIASGDGQSGSIGTKFEGVKDFFGDFALNNPEFHNQMELLVAMMQNVDITKVDGTVEPLYNPVTGKFPFDPVTMKLKEEYRTEDNILNWEEFKVNTKGLAPQNNLIQRYKSVKDKLHGNYRSDDKTIVQSTITGRVATAFLKWLFENTANQYGSKKVSIATMSIDIKGRKLPLLDRFPVLASHLLMQNVSWTSVATSAAAIAGVGIPVLPVIGALNVGLMGAVLYFNRKNISASKNDFMLAGNYLTEILARSISTTVTSLTRGKVTINQSLIEKLSGIDENTVKNRNTDLKTRRLMSESAQEVADKFSMYTQFTLAGLTMKALYILSLAGIDDDEREKELNKIEKYLNFLLNMRNSMTDEMEKWTNVKSMVDSHSQIILYKYVSDSMKKFQQAYDKYQDGSVSKSKAIYNSLETVSDLGFGFPRILMRLADETRTPFAEDRIFGGSSSNIVDSMLLKGHRSPEAKFEDVVRREVKRTRLELEPIYRKKIREQLEAEGKSKIDLDKLTKEMVTKKLKEAKVYKTEKRSYKDIAERTDWKKIVESAKKD